MGVIAVAAGAVLLVLVLTYNSLVGKRNQVDNVASTVDVLLKKRHDLIPNLVAAVRQYMTHERDLLARVTELRSRALAAEPGSAAGRRIEGELGEAVGRILVQAEAYPTLKANESFIQLQGALNEVEEQVSAARRAFNAAVTAYNDAVQMFPSSLVAGVMGFRVRTWFEAAEAERQKVDVAKLFEQK